jgi:hypothetical protein
VANSVLVSTAYLPPIAYFLKVISAETIFIEKEENYLKQTYRNRCEIYTANGKLSLIIPVIKTNGNHTMIKDIKVDYSGKWQLQHWRAIVSAYNQSPYFLFYKDAIEPFYFKKFEYLIDFNTQLLKTILKFFKKNPEILFTNSFVKPDFNNSSDFRYQFNPNSISAIKNNLYAQVFGEKHGFLPNLSIIDLVFNLGPESLSYLDLERSNLT